MFKEKMMISKEVESDRLVLKPLSFEELIYINNIDLTKVRVLIEQEALLEETRIAISKKIDKMRNVSEDVHQWYTYWLIINKSTNKGIGFIGFKGVPNEKGYVEVGYSISPNYRKNGFMTEALSMIKNWASRYPGCNGVTANKVLKTNIGSQRVLSNCNFELVSSSDEYYNYLVKFTTAKMQANG